MFVAFVLPVAPRPIAGELISSWLLRVSLANGLTLAQLVEAIETRFPAAIQEAFIDDQLSARALSALATFLRVPANIIKALELSQRFPELPTGWILRPQSGDMDFPQRFFKGEARYAFCPSCLQEMIACTQTVLIRNQWALAFLTHCARHRTPLRERCPVCFIEDPILAMTKPT